ncbi:MAG: DNA recombination protein RmuC [Succinivibrio sp.]
MVYLIALLVVLLLVVFQLISLYKSRAELLEQSASDRAYATAAKENLSEALKRIGELELSVKDESSKRNELASENKLLEFDNSKMSQELTSLRNNLDVLQSSFNLLKEENVSLKAQLDSSKTLAQEQQKRFDFSYKELQEQLKVIGNEFIKNGTADLNKSSKENIVQCVNPLKEEILNFRKFITDTQNSNIKTSAELRQEIKILGQSHDSLSKQAQELSKALCAGAKSQGMWGELQLERVLDKSGLTKGIEYEREVAGDYSNGEKGRPDVVVRLPENHCLIIDSKCSLTAYTRFINSSDEAEREKALKEHISSVKKHLSELYEKDYSSYQSFNSPSFVFMFVPVDGALSEVLYTDDAIYDEAAAKGVYLVSPSTLIPALRVVSNLWILSEQSDRMRKLAGMAKTIFDRLNLVVESAEKLKGTLKKADEHYSDLEKRLYTGNRSLSKAIENFDSKSRNEFKEIDGNIIDNQNPFQLEEDK